MITKQELGDRIRQIRQERKISQGDLGKALNRSHAAVSDIELGKTDLSVSDLTVIANFFQIPITEFIESSKTASTVAFSHNRLAKNIHPSKLEEVKIASKSFDDHVAELASKQNK